MCRVESSLEWTFEINDHIRKLRYPKSADLSHDIVHPTYGSLHFFPRNFASICITVSQESTCDRQTVTQISVLNIFLWMNINRLLVTLDLSSPPGKECNPELDHQKNFAVVPEVISYRLTAGKCKQSKVNVINMQFTKNNIWRPTWDTNR